MSVTVGRIFTVNHANLVFESGGWWSCARCGEMKRYSAVKGRWVYRGTVEDLSCVTYYNTWEEYEEAI